MQYLKIGETDISGMVSGMRPSYEVILSEDSGRNARGDNKVDIINRKVRLDCTFRPLIQPEMDALLAAVETYVFSMSFLDSKTGELKTIQAYISTASPDYYQITERRILYKPMQLAFIEM